MKGYLVHDKTLGSYYCSNLNNTGWLNKGQIQYCVIKDKEKAQKAFKMMKLQVRSSTLQLLEIDISDEEYNNIQEELEHVAQTYKRITQAVGHGKDIQKQINAKKSCN